MITAKQLPGPVLILCGKLLTLFMRWKFRKLTIAGVPIKPGHSILLMCNHFSFWDGLLAMYLTWHAIYKRHDKRGFYIMSVEKQLRAKPWLRYFGSFSIAPGINRINESMKYAAGILDVPGNILLFYPQGNLESGHVREIIFQDGINHLIPKIKGDCQLIWCSAITEYFESLRPSVFFSLLDCGTNRDFDFERLVSAVNAFHKEALDGQLRFTPPANRQ